MIGNNIILLKDEKLYNVSNNEMKLFGYIKTSSSDLLQEKTKSNHQNKSFNFNGGIDARYQHEFYANHWYECDGTYRNIDARLKYVHEIVVTSSYYGHGGGFSRMELKVKLEYKSRS